MNLLGISVTAPGGRQYFLCMHIFTESAFQRRNTEKVLRSSAEEKHLHSVGLLSHRLASFCLRSLCFTSDVSCVRSRVVVFSRTGRTTSIALLPSRPLTLKRSVRMSKESKRGLELCVL